ncbi:MAG: hypothetical protein ACSHX7_04925 [Luteolibacter sp.]
MHLSDFPDRLSPMLVKELRQGLRTKSFIGVFLALQIILGIILLTAGASAASDNAGSTISAIIFTFFAIAVLGIQPMRGINAISSEMKENTIDMMVLTRLSTWRIVSGKWFAIVSQSALILVTIIPYLILRYFFGGMNLLGEIVLLSLIFLTSATLTTVTVCLSASSVVILRFLLPVIAMPIAMFTILGFMFAGGGDIKTLIDFCSLDSSGSQIGISIYLFVCSYFGFFMLSTGTSLIAPHAENHATLRRLVALGATLITVVLCTMDFTDPDALPFAFTLVLAPIFAVSMTEFAPLVAPTYRKFSQYGILGKFAGFFLYPGWASGVFFCMVLSLIAAATYFLRSDTYTDDEFYTIALSCHAALLLPAVIVNLFKIKGPAKVSSYVLFIIASVVVGAVMTGIAQSMSNRGFLWLFVWLPPVILFMQQIGSFDDQALLVTAIAINIVFVFILLITSIISYRNGIHEVEVSLQHGEQSADLLVNS